MWFRKFFLVLLSFVFGGKIGWTQNLSTTNQTSVLFIGNSYTHMNDMPKLFESIATAKGQPVYVQKSTKSGASFREHTQRADLYKDIAKNQWDVVVLQGYSRELSLPYEVIDTATMPYVNQLIDTIRANNPCTKIYFYMTWGYAEGYLERPETDTYLKMTEQIAHGYQYMGQILGIPLVPAGRVWQDIRTQHPDIELYDADRAHPSKNGSYATACAFYAAIFDESPEGVFTGSVKGSNGTRIQKSAAKVVLADPQKYGLNKQTIRLKTVSHVNGDNHLYCSLLYQDVIKVQWDFGDGKSSTEMNPFHSYKRPGEYFVRAKVQTECGTRIIQRRIYFKPTIQPKPNDPVIMKAGNKPVKKI